jgi:hypothetical protein
LSEDDNDKFIFLERLSKLLISAGTDCFAWLLLSNHFHLLLRCNSTKLSVLMCYGVKRKELSAARAGLCYIAVVKMGMNGALLSRVLNISRAGVTLAARRGEKIFNSTPELHGVIDSLQN